MLRRRCPLCSEDVAASAIRAYGRDYFDCPTCRLVFLAPPARLDADAERAHYLTHENDPHDPRYRAFLDRLALPLITHLVPGAQGLDFGSGPGPTLSLMLEERGFPTEIYDPFFAPNSSVLEKNYDFITATETIEHFCHPEKEFVRLDELLRPGGILGVMTEIFRDDKPFAQWHYPRDPTHVSFYREKTMQWIAQRFSYAVEMPRPNVVLFRKGA